MKTNFKQDKGVAGLTVLLSIIVALFIIGLLVTIFALIGAGIIGNDSVYERTSAITVTNEAVTQAGIGSAGGDPLAKATLRGVECSIVQVYNSTVAGRIISAGNYTTGTTSCYIKNTTTAFSSDDWKVNYTYTYLADEYGTVSAINDTIISISSVTDYFGIFIVISAMVVLILLTVIIITAIRSSGMIGGMGQRANQVGTA